MRKDIVLFSVSYRVLETQAEAVNVASTTHDAIHNAKTVIDTLHEYSLT